MWVTWGNTAADAVGTITQASTELSVDIDLRLYAAGIDTTAAAVIDATSSAAYDMVYYLQFMNPYETATAPNTALSALVYDGVVMDVKITTTAGGPAGTSNPDQAVFDWDTDA